MVESERSKRILHELGHHTISALYKKKLNKYLTLSKKSYKFELVSVSLYLFPSWSNILTKVLNLLP